MIRFGIVGCGRIGSRHAKHINTNPESSLVAVFDKDSDRGELLSTQYSCDNCRNLDELLSRNDIDIISVCTPNGDHFPTGKAVLDSSKDVLIEKPMTLRRKDCERLIDLAYRKGKNLFVVKQNRFNPPIEALRKLVDEQALGKIYMVVVNCFWNRNKAYYDSSDWRGTKDLDGGTLFTQFSHFVDILYYLFGDIDDIKGTITNASHQDQIEFEDTGVFSFRLADSGGVGSFNYTTSSFKQNMEGSITVFAENATIKVGGKYLNTLEYQATNLQEIPVVVSENKANDYGFYEGSMSNHDIMIQNVIDALKGRSQIRTNALDGLKVVDIIERMYAAAKTQTSSTWSQPLAQSVL